MSIIVSMRWDIFCKVVDNFGDIGVCWRLAADLAGRGETVRFHLDDRGSLAWMAPGGAPGVQVQGWQDAVDAGEPGDVVIAAFGCELPAAYAARMVRPRPPVWIDLEYLSAESYVERSHGLPSPCFDGPGAGLTEWYFYPGFTKQTGGLLREPDLFDRQRAFDRAAWLRSRGFDAQSGHPDARTVSLFCYRNPALDRLLDTLAEQPTLLLVAAGLPAQEVGARLGPTLRRGLLRAVMLPLLSQLDYDRLLWSCDLNFVRGEDSFVRAQWAGAPFVWQAYPQADGAHHRKVEAFLDRFMDGAPDDAAAAVRTLHLAWNGAAPWPSTMPPAPHWRRHCLEWRAGLAAQADLTTQLLRFTDERR